MKTHQYFILHKPYGYLSQFVNNQTKRKKKMLGELYDFPEGTMAVGRLDVNSEGLLLLTTNGKVSEYIRSKKVEKEYCVQVDGVITQKEIDLLKKGVEISIEGKNIPQNTVMLLLFLLLIFRTDHKKYVMKGMDQPVGFQLQLTKENLDKFVK